MKIATTFALALVLAGCGGPSKKSPPTTTQDAAPPDVSDVIKNVEDAGVSLKRALGSLQIVVEGRSDAAKGREAYLADLAKLDTDVQLVRDRAADINRRRDAYLQEWLNRSAAIKSESVKAAAEKRRTELMSEFMTLSARGSATRKAFAPLHGALQDCGRFLESDSTPAGAASLAPEYENIRKMEAEVHQAAADYKAQLAKIAELLGLSK
jgi:hypothetical protein